MESWDSKSLLVLKLMHDRVPTHDKSMIKVVIYLQCAVVAYPILRVHLQSKFGLGMLLSIIEGKIGITL